jgi:hypothetical protein
MSSIQAITFTEAKVGKRIKASKKKYSWALTVDGKSLLIDLYISKLSHKTKVVVNEEILQSGKQPKGSMFQFTHEFLGHQINLIQQGED